MARVSANITPDLLLPSRYNQQNMYNGKSSDPGGGDEYLDDADRCEVNLEWLRCRIHKHYQLLFI